MLTRTALTAAGIATVSYGVELEAHTKSAAQMRAEIISALDASVAIRALGEGDGEDSGSGGNWMLSMAWGLVEDQITDHMWEWLCDEWELCVGDSYQEIIESLSGEVLGAVYEMVTGGEEAATL